MISNMELYLLIPIFAFVVSFFITHRVGVKNFEGSKLSRAYIGKFLWGFRTLLFPTISLWLLLQYDLRVYCLSLLLWVAVNVLLRQIFREEKRRRPAHFYFGLTGYIFLIITLVENNPFWFQIWPSVFFLGTFLAAIGAAIRGTATELSSAIYDTEPLSNVQIEILNVTTPFLALLCLILNEWFRTQTSFEAWAFFHAFLQPVFVLIVGLGTIIFVPIFIRD